MGWSADRDWTVPPVSQKHTQVKNNKKDNRALESCYGLKIMENVETIEN
jgi:hypothetical protein